MKRLFFLFICSAFCLSVMAQNVKKIDKAAQREMKTAEVYISDFRRKDVIKYYTVCCLYTQKKYRELKFDTIPSYEHIVQYLDFNYTPIDEVLAKTGELTWKLHGKYSNHNSYCYGCAKNITLYEYLDSVKADRAYSLFGDIGYIIIEKNGVRYPVRKEDGKYIKCQLRDFVSDINEFNVFHFPSTYHGKPIIGF